MNITNEEHERVVKTMENLKNKLNDVMDVLFEVVDCDLIKNQDGCTNPSGSHEVAKYKNPETGKVQLLCIHCLKGFKVATEFKGAFFIPKKEDKKKVKPVF